MGTVLLIIEAVASVIGSFAAGILLCWLLWMLFRIIRHPAWGPPLVVAPVILAFAGRLPSSEFLHMALVFALVAAIPFWAEGKAWRVRWRDRHGRPGGRLGAGIPG